MSRVGVIADWSEAQAFAEAEAHACALFGRWNGNQRGADERGGSRDGDEDSLEGHNASVARKHGRFPEYDVVLGLL